MESKKPSRDFAGPSRLPGGLKDFHHMLSADAIPTTVRNHSSDADLVQTMQENVKELFLDLKSITQLYNEYVVPFELWEIFGDTDSSIVRETWARLIDHALSRGGIVEAFAVLKRVGSHFYSEEVVVVVHIVSSP